MDIRHLTFWTFSVKVMKILVLPVDAIEDADDGDEYKKIMDRDRRKMAGVTSKRARARNE